MTTARTRGETTRQQRGIDRAAMERASRDAPTLTVSERVQVLTELGRMIEGIYVHLPLKRAMYGIDPVQQLRRLRDRAGAKTMDEQAFHAEVARILQGLRDAHTTYIGPMAIEGVVARLPLLVEQFGPETSPRFLVSKTIADLIDDPDLTEGVELEYWNGTPIADAVRRHAADERGGRPDSGMARAVDSLTFRALGYMPMPLEHWVVVGYRTATGAQKETRLMWRFIMPGEGPEPVRPTEAAATAAAIHPDRSVIRRAKKLSFNPGLWRTERADRADRQLPMEATTDWMAGRFQDNVSARKIPISAAEYGYLRLWSFDLVDDDGYVEEVVQLIRLLPEAGLIIDLRGNPGGLIWAAERLLQLFTPNHIEPTRFSLLATDMTRAMSHAPQNRRSLSPWHRSLGDAQSTGELYSQGVPITPVERCNDIGQVYGGPVVAVVDATTYSAGDLFAAGFADNNIGTIVSVGQATGAGGANVWRSDTLRAVLSGTAEDLGPLPGGVGFTLAVRRATRIGASEGAPIEDIGIVGHRTYAMTRDDLLRSNADLLSFCTRLIEAEPTTAMTVTANPPDLVISSSNISRVDIYVDGRPLTSRETDGMTVVTVTTEPDEIRVEGYRGDLLVQVRRLQDRGGSLQ